MMKIISIHPYN